MSHRSQSDVTAPAGWLEHSAVWRAVRWPVRRLAACWRSLDALDGAPWPPPASSIVQLERVVADSRIARPASLLVALIARAGGTSRTMAWGREVLHDARRLPLDIIVRLGGVTLMTALAIHAVSLALMPPRLRPGLPSTFGALLLMFAFAMIAASGSIARAWTTWKAR